MMERHGFKIPFFSTRAFGPHALSKFAKKTPTHSLPGNRGSNHENSLQKGQFVALPLRICLTRP